MIIPAVQNINIVATETNQANIFKIMNPIVRNVVRIVSPRRAPAPLKDSRDKDHEERERFKSPVDCKRF